MTSIPNDSKSVKEKPAEIRKKIFFSGWDTALERAPLFLSVVLLFTVPFITQLRGMDPLYPKQAVAQILISMLFAVWVLKSFLSGKVVLAQSNALLPFAGLLVWIPLTLAFSPWRLAGLEGLASWECYPLWYLMLTFTCLEAWKGENLLITLLAGGVGTCGWALAQVFGLGQGDWLQIVREQFGGRVTAGLGNPNFLAGYLLLIWPLALGLFQKASTGIGKWFWACLVTAGAAAMVFTGSKAGWLGLAAEVGVYLFFFFLGGGRGKAAGKMAVLGVGFVLLTAFLPPLGPRLREGFSVKNESVTFRMGVWKGAARMVEDRPFWGTGFGTFAAAFPSYRPLGFALGQTERSTEVDHAHNWILEWTAETGVLGLGLLVWFWSAVLSQWWKLFSANAIPRSLGAGAFAAFAGIAVENLFDVDGSLPSTLIPLLFLAAFPVALSGRFHQLEGFPIRQRELDIRKIRVYLLPLAALASAFALQQTKTVFQKQWADIRLKEASVLSEAGKWDPAIKAYGEVLAADPGDEVALYFRSSTYAARDGSGDPARALMDLMEVERVYPDYVLLHFKKAGIFSTLGRPQEAKVEMQKALDLDPALIFHLPEFQRAGDLAEGKNFSGALALYEKMIFDYPTCVPALVDEANCLVNLKRVSEARLLYQRVLVLDPDSAEASQNLRSLDAANQK